MAPAAPSPCARNLSQDQVAGVTKEGDIRLRSGRVVALLDLRWPDDPEAAAKSRSLLGSMAGEDVEVAAAGEADRWGRLPAALTLRSGNIDLADLLAAEGFAMVSVEERGVLCGTALLVREATARAQRRGLWSHPGTAPLPSSDLSALTARVGRFALVEGRVRSVGERKDRTYLNFGAFGEPGFTVTVPRRVWLSLRDKGMSAQALRLARVRVRGTLEAWRGVVLEITAPAMLEVLDERPLSR